MRSKLILIALFLSAGALVPGIDSVNVVSANDRENVVMWDDCDPNADWGPGGCLLEEGSVSRAEFVAFLASPLSINPVFVGHPSWRNDPGYLTVEPGERVRVRNRGGRNHTFTRVAQFGGGVVAPLSAGFNLAPECPAAAVAGIVAPGGRALVEGLSIAGDGNNRYMCCFHPWMRTVIKVVPEEEDVKSGKR